MKFTCILVDDEPLSHHVLKDHLKKVGEVQVIGSFFNAKEAGRYLDSHTVDIMILDIQMPELSGLDFLRSLHVRPVSIISTAHRDYAIDGFELGVIDYLLKPIEFERFELAMKRATDFVHLVKYGDSVDFEKLVNTFEILIKTGTKKLLIDYRTILFAQGLKDYTILHTQDKKYVVKGSVKALEEYLPSSYFVRVHKSFIVAIPKIKVVHKGKIELGAISIPVGRNFKDRVERILRGI